MASRRRSVHKAKSTTTRKPGKARKAQATVDKPEMAEPETPAAATPTTAPERTPATDRGLTITRRVSARSPLSMLPPLLETPVQDAPEEKGLSIESSTSPADDGTSWGGAVPRAVTGPITRWPTSGIGRLGLGFVAAARGAVLGAARCVIGTRGEEAFCRDLDDNHWPTRPLRIGINDRDLRALLERASGACVVEWIDVDNRNVASDAIRRMTLDALVRRDVRGGIHASSRAILGREPAWHDWASARPVTFSALFPGRVDSAELFLPPASKPNADLRPLRLLLESLAAFSRHPSRLDAKERLRGRTPIIDVVRGLSLPPIKDPVRDVARLIMLELGSAMENVAHPDPTTRAAARLLSAFATGSDDLLPESTRLRLVETCARLAGDEPEITLRLAAARFASYADADAMRTLLRAERLLAQHELKAGHEQSMFIQAELETGRGAPISLGRVAAGIALVCASLDAKQIPYFRDDLLDDARFSSWIIPKDQDRRVLMDIFRELQKQRDEVVEPAPLRQAA